MQTVQNTNEDHSGFPLNMIYSRMRLIRQFVTVPADFLSFHSHSLIRHLFL